VNPPLTRRDHLSFKGNLAGTRHGWLRLTPAYSVQLVSEILDGATPGRVLDPFCGTGTTALACAERGIACDTTDINPFLLWLTAAKARRYRARDLRDLRARGAEVAAAMARPGDHWTPPLHRIERWWDAPALAALAAGKAAIRGASPTSDLLHVAFCRAAIECAHVSFGHQSMSFKQRAPRRAVEVWDAAVASIAGAAASPVVREPRPILCDARDLGTLDGGVYDLVITSPPYPNRMSYIRELRPYMYWLGYLADGAAAGELDWQAIGGTWGRATSNVARWTPETPLAIRFDGFEALLDRIGRRSPLLSRYVHRYFHDMVRHTRALHRVVAPGGRVVYVVGNSRFYDVLVPVEQIFAALFESAGFHHPAVSVLRKRTSKAELFEFVVTATKK